MAHGNKKTANGGYTHYSDAKKIEVVTSYLALGKAPLVEALTGVPQQTIRQWKCTPWWKDLEDSIRADEDAELDTKLSKTIDKTLDVVMDRLQNGDFILDSRTGTIKRVPVKMRDAHRVTMDTVDKRNLIRGKPTSITAKGTVEDAMNKLAGQFKEWANLIKRNERAIDGEVVREESGRLGDSHSFVEGREGEVSRPALDGLSEPLDIESIPEDTSGAR